MNRAEKTNSSQIRLSLPHEPFAALPKEALTKSGYQAYILSLIIVAGIYLIAAKLGLSLAFLNASVSPVWPPTGVAIAAVMLLGYQISPAIFVAALVANLATGLPVATATGIAAGNTLEAICAGFLVHRFVGFHIPFYRARDVLKFVLLAVLFSPMVSATIGNASLCLGGADHWANFWSLWLTWWIGDGVGALVVAPLVLTWVERSSERWPASRWAEGLLLLLALFAATTVLFRETLPNNFVNLSLGRLIVPFLLWAAFRLGPRGVATAIAVYSSTAVWGTRLGSGPIVGQSPNDSLLLLQVSIAAIGITFLVVAGLVAERKRGENALSLLASIVESTDDAVMGIALDGTILSWNEGAERLHGYTAHEVVGRSVAILIPPDRSEELRQILEQLGQGESIDRLETERLRKDGGIVLVSLTMSPIKDSGGQVIAASVIARDITRRRRAQSRLAGNLAITRILAESPALSDATPRILQTICETLGWEFGAMWAVDPDANVMRCLKVWHDPAEKEQGFESVSYNSTFPPGVGLPGRVWASLKPAWIPDVATDSNFPRAPFAVAEGLHAAFAFPIVSGEKLMAVMEFFSNEIREPDEALLAMFESIGSQIGQFVERKRAEEELRQREEQLRLALEAADMGAWDYDVQSGAVKWSSSLERIHGIPLGSFGGTFDDYIADTHPDDRQYVLTSLASTLERGADHDIEYRIVRPDGTVRWVQGKGEVIHDSSGKAIRLTGVCMDVTARKEAETDREQLLAREREARTEAEAANRAKDEFLALVSHELRTPLNAIAGWVDILLAKPDKDEGLTARALEVIKRNAGLQTRIVEDILDVSRIVTGKMRLVMSPVELSAIIQSAVNVVKPAADARQVTVHVELDQPVRPVSGDPQRLQQIVCNLLSNAIKFSHRGGDVEIKLGQIEAGAQITVSDNGDGIPADFLPRIFDRFSQADSSTTRKYGGLGLGLAIVQQLVNLHGGTVSAYSPGEDQGSVFSVVFPCVTKHTEASVATQASDDGKSCADAASTLTGLRILIVDDDSDSRDALSALLVLRAAEVRSVATVREALDVIADWQPHVLISDIGMPDEDGYDLIRKVRAREAGDGGYVPAIALTGYAAVEESERALSAGYQMHMGKPIEADHLIRAIASLGWQGGHESAPLL